MTSRHAFPGATAPAVRRIALAVIVSLSALLAIGTPAIAGTAPDVTPAARHSPAGPSWRPPLPAPMRPVRGFDPPEVPWGAGHRGVDIAARAGEAVHAAGAGTVSFSGTIDGVGIVAITHGTLRTTYLPVASRVRRGARVRAGQPIGVVAAGFRHCPAQVCLHWGLLRGDRYLDPMSLLAGGPIRLLPLHPAATAGGGRPDDPGRTTHPGPADATVRARTKRPLAGRSRAVRAAPAMRPAADHQPLRGPARHRAATSHPARLPALHIMLLVGATAGLVVALVAAALLIGGRLRGSRDGPPDGDTHGPVMRAGREASRTRHPAGGAAPAPPAPRPSWRGVRDRNGRRDRRSGGAAGRHRRGSARPLPHDVIDLAEERARRRRNPR